jgi:GNAT superfamily N-acetyltransferase
MTTLLRFEQTPAPCDLEAVVRDVLREWPLYEDTDLVQLYNAKTFWSIQYCRRPSKPGVVAFTGSQRLDDDPPNYVSLNWKDDGVLYLLFIQLHADFRGLGYGHQLYERIIELGRRLGCHAVRQTPSGGYKEQTRKDYLLRRGWLPVPRAALELEMPLGGEVHSHGKEQENKG